MPIQLVELNLTQLYEFFSSLVSTKELNLVSFHSIDGQTHTHTFDTYFDSFTPSFAYLKPKFHLKSHRFCF